MKFLSKRTDNISFEHLLKFTSSTYLLSFLLINYFAKVVKLELLYPLTVFIFVIGSLEIIRLSKYISFYRLISSFVLHLIPFYMYKSKIKGTGVILANLVLMFIFSVYCTLDLWPYLHSPLELFIISCLINTLFML